ncbi:MAG: AraC family transcriptional regulator [Verrucomicrobia bacterium 12-59-8]|nr:MAG: AraC family transcriptional regulator [Verrucomicrobia bacterium 12-59-8]
MQHASNSSKNNPESLSGKLTKSRLFQDYQSAFESATGLPLHLHETGGLPGELSSRPGGNAFCLLMAKSNQACAACFALQQKIEQQAGMEPRSLHCFAGLCESAVPVRVGEKVIAFLQTGQILLHRPDKKQFTKVAQTLIELGTEIDLKKAEEAWFATTVLKESQYQAMLRLLHIFSGHLSECANALSLEAQSAESASVTKAKVIVQTNSDDEISLGRVAKAVNVSAGYFSELFHQTTGLTFTEYVARVRVEKVKNLLANPRLQITTIAYDTGFKSLSQFNRVFKRVCGVNPREYREGLTGTATS